MPAPAKIPLTKLAFAFAATLALAVRLVYWAQVAGTPFDEWHLMEEGDMATYLEQARRIAAGDIFAHEPYHPYHAWQPAAGTAADWQRWYGPHGFHQAPLYSYVMAALSRVTDSYLGVVRVLQILLGTGTCVLLGLLARRLAGNTAGITTALLTALYGPLYYLELQYLREGPAMFLAALLLLFVVRHVTADNTQVGPGQRWRRPFVIGTGIGVFHMFHEFAAVVATAALLVLTGHAARRSLRAAVMTGSLVLGGAVVGFSPLLVRNLVVGAPAFQASSRPHITLAMCNHPAAVDGGVIFSAPGPELRPMLDAAGNSVFGVIRELWRSYDGDVGRMLGNWLLRLRAVFSTVERPDNTSFSFHRANVGVLATSPTFGLVLPLGAAAIVWLIASAVVVRRRHTAALTRKDREDETPAWFGARAAHMAVLTHLPLLVVATTLVNSVARYRLLFVPIFLIYAGVFAGLAVRSWRQRNHKSLVGLVVLAIAGSFAQSTLTARWDDADSRHSDSTFVAIRFDGRREDAKALHFFQEALARAPDHPDLHIHYAIVLARVGRLPEAIAAFRYASRLRPDDPDLSKAIRELELEMRRQQNHPARR